VNGTFVDTPLLLLISIVPLTRLPLPFAWKLPATAKNPKAPVPEKTNAYGPLRLALLKGPVIGVGVGLTPCSLPPPHPMAMSEKKLAITITNL
jgi:hypothetical protein